MSAAARKLFGLAVLLAGLVLYALLAMRLAVAVLPDDLIVQTLYYVAAGVIWIVPAVPFVRWVQGGGSS